MRRLYAAVVRTSDRMLLVDARSAELIKYASNAYLAMRVSFINDVARLCDRIGADVELVRRGMGMDTRIGPKFLFPGIGFGGSCFPKDVRALLHTAREHGMALPIVAATESINERQKQVLFHKLLRHFDVPASAADAARPEAYPLSDSHRPNDPDHHARGCPATRRFAACGGWAARVGNAPAATIAAAWSKRACSA